MLRYRSCLRYSDCRNNTSSGSTNMSAATRRAWMKSSGVATLYSFAALALRTPVGQAREVSAKAPDTAGTGTAGAAAPAGARLPLSRLSLNENPFGCSPAVAEAIRNSLADLNRYTERDAERLTAQIAAKEGVTPEQVVLGEVLSALGTQLSVTGGPGGEFIYSIPGFTDLVAAAEHTEGTAVGVPLDERLENDLPALTARINSRTRSLYIVNPHNPSGTVSDVQRLKTFVQEVSQRVPVIVDEAYLELTDSFTARTLTPLVAEGHDVVVFRTFDKAYGLAALQFGYAVAPAALANSLRQRGVGAAHGLNRLAVVAAAAALRDTHFIEETRRRTAEERNRWHRALQGLGLRHSDSQGSFVFFQTGHPYDAIAAGFLAEGIQIGRSFAPLDQWIRVSIGLPEENIRAIGVLRKLLRQ
jgi:histidinol-phosphate aminotransferase